MNVNLIIAAAAAGALVGLIAYSLAQSTNPRVLGVVVGAAAAGAVFIGVPMITNGRVSLTS